MCDSCAASEHDPDAPLGVQMASARSSNAARSPIEIGPPTGDLQVRLAGEPPVTGSMAARPRSLDELRGEPLHPPVHADVVNGDAALGQQFPGHPGRTARTAGTSGPRPRSRQAGTESQRRPEAVRRAVTEPLSCHPRSTNATVPLSACRVAAVDTDPRGRNFGTYLAQRAATSRYRPMPAGYLGAGPGLELLRPRW